MTLTLTPTTETRLRTFAAEQLKDTLAGLDQSMADFAAGRWITSEEFDRRLETKLADARAKSVSPGLSR
jgi:hypothetical protein